MLLELQFGRCVLEEGEFTTCVHRKCAAKCNGDVRLRMEGQHGGGTFRNCMQGSENSTMLRRSWQGHGRVFQDMVTSVTLCFLGASVFKPPPGRPLLYRVTV